MAAQRRIDIVVGSVRRLLRVGALPNLLNLLQKQHPVDLAEIFASLNAHEQRAAFDARASKDPKLAMQALAEFGVERAAALLADREPAAIAGLLHELPLDDAAAIIDSLPETLAR